MTRTGHGPSPAAREAEEQVLKFFTIGSHNEEVPELSYLRRRDTQNREAVKSSVAGLIVAAIDALYHPEQQPIENLRWRLMGGLTAESVGKKAGVRQRMAYEFRSKPLNTRGAEYGFKGWQNALGKGRVLIAQEVIRILRDENRREELMTFDPWDHPLPDPLELPEPAPEMQDPASAALDVLDEGEPSETSAASSEESPLSGSGETAPGRRRDSPQWWAAFGVALTALGFGVLVLT